MQARMAIGAIDPVVGCICGAVPFKGPFAIGHECVAQVVAVGTGVQHIRVGQTVVVPWAVSCGSCAQCRRCLTSKCATTTSRALAAYGFGPASGPWGGMIVDELRVPFADHMLVPVPTGVPPLRVAAAGDNLADAWRSVVAPLSAPFPVRRTRCSGRAASRLARHGSDGQPIRQITLTPTTG
jgi:threonine dehydrogenase-like Zn-dependent dehydrogenase